jgi:hypothetical protein
MLGSEHPLVGKRIVKENPTKGEVTKDLINRTLGRVRYAEAGNWAAMDIGERNSWTLTHDINFVITEVVRH